MDAEQLCEIFELGRPLKTPRVAASGWGNHNLLWRLETSDGVFAIKEVRRESSADTDASFRIELDAHHHKVPSARPRPSTEGRCFAQIDGAHVRCHEWVHGTAKANEETNAQEANAMGAIVARLHLLGLDAPAEGPPTAFGRDHWLGLASQVTSDSSWGSLIREHVDRIVEAEALGAAAHDDETVGSHRDLNAHNVLFDGDTLVLIDWDAAGPASPRFERASYATLWAQTQDGGHDLDRAVGFLRGYVSAGGTVTADDVAILPQWLNGLSWWTEQNVRLAVAQTSDEQDDLAAMLVRALIAGPDTVRTRQELLAAAIARL